MINERCEEAQETALRQLTAFRGKLYRQQAERFADRAGQLIVKYDREQDTIQLTDGEVYSMRLVIWENAAAFVIERMEQNV